MLVLSWENPPHTLFSCKYTTTGRSVSMKVCDILGESEESAARAGRTRFSEEELETLYAAMKGTREMDRAQIRELANKLVDEGKWSRTVGSAELGLNRMHVLVHAAAPTDATERTAETWMVPSQVMDAFATKKGINVDAAVTKARKELKGRPRKVKRDEAKKMMAQAAREHFTKEQRMKINRKQREQIMGDIQAGMDPKQAIQKQL
jgi:hypothetical protein